MRTILVLLLAAMLAGCTASDEPAEDPVNEPTPEDPTPALNETLNLTITAFEATVANGTAPLNVTFQFNGTGDDIAWSLDADGDGTGDVDGTGFPANATFRYEVAGVFNATLTATSGNETTNATLSIAVDVAGPTGPSFDSGSIASSSSGAVASADIGRTQFDITGPRDVLAVTTFMEDPLAKEGGQEYTVRFTPPSGGNNDYTATYGSTILIENPEVGTWEIGVFMVAAGAFDWTAEWCAFTGDACPA